MGRFSFKQMMKSGMNTIISKQHKIFNSIVRMVIIDVMHNFFRFKVSLKKFFHYKTVFIDIISSSFKRMFRFMNKNISTTFNSASCPIRIFFSNQTFMSFFKRPFVYPSFNSMQRNMAFFKRCLRNSSSFNSFKLGWFFLKRFPITFGRTIFFIPRRNCRKFFITYKTFFNYSFFASFCSAFIRAINRFRVFFVKKFFFASRTNFHKPSFCLKAFIIIALVVGSCQLVSYKSYALSNAWEDDDSRVDGSIDTMDEVDTFINTLSLDIHERLLSTNGETVDINTAWTAAGQTCADLGTVTTAAFTAVTNLGVVTTADINGGTMDGVTLGGASAVAISNTSSLVASGDLDIGTYELRANTFESDVATGTAPFTIASTTKSTNLNADLLDGSHASTTTGSAIIPIADASGYLPDNSVDTTALKTASSEVSAAAGAGYAHLTLGGGLYAFFPQTKRVGGSQGYHGYLAYTNTSTTYTTTITVAGWANDEAVYAQNYYVTASGKDYWLFLLTDKLTGDILSGYSAPDHPAYGNGGNFDKMPHPFGSYDETKHKIILVDLPTIRQIQQEAKDGGVSLLTYVNENLKIAEVDEEYQPIHSGKFIDENGEYVKQVVKTIPEYIKVRKLIKLTDEDKAVKEERQRESAEKYKKEQEEKEINKKLILEHLGLTEEGFRILMDR